MGVAEPLWTIAQAAEYLGISGKHFRREIIGKGLIEVISLGISAKGDRIAPSDITKLVETRRRQRCLESAGKSGTLNLRSVGRSFSDPLGLPTKGKRRSSSAT